jgi:methylated-DNA-[protein]-cysteine S-methyltransferase
MNNYQTHYLSPVGELLITCTDEAITGILFTDTDQSSKEEKSQISSHITYPEVMRHCTQQLDEYFAGNRKEFDFPIMQEGTAFQQSVWRALCEIPFGKTISYLELARRIGNEKSIRAVGTTNGKNKISIVVPCHRVIGANGNLTGYGGGLWRKSWLLEHEQQIAYGVQKLF